MLSPRFYRLILKPSPRFPRYATTKTKEIPELSTSKSTKRSRKKLVLDSSDKIVDQKASNDQSIPNLATVSNTNPDVNELGIPTISADLHQRLFGNDSMKNAKNFAIDAKTLYKIRSRISAAAGVDVKQLLGGMDGSVAMDNLNIQLPELRDQSIEGHFRAIAEEQVRTYRDLAWKLASCKPPEIPSKTSWSMKPGWTKYGSDGSAVAVDFPEEDAFFFDVEVSCSTKKPTLAVAMSVKAWYSWCSEELCIKKNRLELLLTKSDSLRLEDMIPLESKPGQCDGFEQRQKLVIGHNVAFDRSYVKEQYFLEKTNVRFLDTMSMHIATSGFANVQRLTHLKRERARSGESATVDKAEEEFLAKEDDWESKGSMNSLLAVHGHYCPESQLQLDKEARDIFVHGTLEDVRKRFADSMHYCARDVAACYEVFAKLWPDFLDRFQHPVTLSGMLEMGTAYLPINESWFHFIDAADGAYDARTRGISDKFLVQLANQAVGLLRDAKFRDDPWLWDEDWNTFSNTGFYKKSGASKPSKAETPKEFVQQVWDTFAEKARKTQPYLSKFPRWYADLCSRHRGKFETLEEACNPAAKDIADVNESWGPLNITMQMRIAPKLLRMHYKGYPLHFFERHGWGYLVPKEDASANVDHVKIVKAKKEMTFPLRRLIEVVAQNRQRLGWEATAVDENSGPSYDCGISGVTFYKLPHKNGFACNVGHPLGKDFLHLIEEGKLMSQHPEHAQRLADINRVCSYWKNSRDRIREQMALLFYQTDEDGKMALDNLKNNDFRYGAIVPRVITSGTVTRRAVEPLWMTASNAKEVRIGSELKSMVQAPPGYVLVGADVDSQELWIASLLGDSWKYKMHGCTPFSWMLLRGDKANGTDQHSMVAEELGVTRDEAKVLNYGRIYGAGLPFATVLLKKFRPNENAEVIHKLAKRLYGKTKGWRRRYCTLTAEGARYIEDDYGENATTDRFDVKKAMKSISERSLTYDQFCEKEWMEWEGGTESDVFNCLERIALSDKAATPVLGCRLSRALELGSVNKGFLPSRVNWVVQSSAVDYLHLMLVCMRWLFDKYEIDGRFSISIHDEVRYLVSEKDKYRAALALQITNLLTRAMFVSTVGMTGLPRSVAFFNKVDIDKALRKEVFMDAATPSNQLGLRGCYRVPHGDALDIRQIVEKTGGGRLDKVP